MGDGLFTFYNIVAVRNVALQQKPDDLTVYEEFSEFPFWGIFYQGYPTLGCRLIGTKAVKRRQIKDMDYPDIIIMSS